MDDTHAYAGERWMIAGLRCCGRRENADSEQDGESGEESGLHGLQWITVR
jgi:hypothetical protein